MKITNNKITALSILILMLITALSCTPDLNVENLNDPDTQRTSLDSERAESLVAGAHNRVFWLNTWMAPAGTLSAMAGETASSWDWMAINDLSSIPRTAFNNEIAYNYSGVTYSPWVDAYRGIAAAVDGLQFMALGGQFENADADRRMEAYAKFLIGYLHGKIAQLFDQGFIFDENTDLEQPMDPVDYQTLMTFALGKLEEAKAIAAANTFQIPSDWMPGSNWSSADMVKLIHSIQAYFMATVTRSAAERDAVNWASVKTHIENGLTGSWMFESNGFTGLWSGWHTYGQLAGWTRCSYFTIGPADTSGSYDEWINTPILSRDSQSRQPFVIFTPDIRITSGNSPYDAFGTKIPGKDFDHVGTKIHYRWHSPFPSARGTYHHSMYGWSEFDWYYNLGGGAAGNLPMLAIESLDYILAEAELRLGNKQAAADLINKYRVEDGGLPEVSADLPAGTPTDARDIFGTTLWSLLKYEKGLQTYGYDGWQAWMDKRGWGTLITGTVINFPIPARELELLQMENYTLGGPGNPGGAPKVIPAFPGHRY